LQILQLGTEIAITWLQIRHCEEPFDRLRVNSATKQSP
jgi:hypothetical protein